MDLFAGPLPAAYLLLAPVAALVPLPRRRALAGAGVAVLGLAAAAAAAATATSVDRTFQIVNAGLAVGGIALILAGMAARLPSAATVAVRDALAPPSHSGPLLLQLAGLVLAFWAPHLLAFGAGALLAMTGAAWTAVRDSRPGALAVLGLAALLFVAALWLTLTISGPLGGSMGALAGGPFSVAAERLLTFLYGAAGLLLAGIPPFHRLPWVGQLAPLSAALLVRIITPAFPLGLATWQSTAMLILLASLAWSAWRSRWASLAIAGGCFALWSGEAAAAIPGTVLVGWGWLVDSGALATRRGVRLRPRWAGLPAVPAAWAALPALEAALRSQVLLSVLAAGTCAAGLAVRAARGPRHLHGPLY